VGPATEKALRP